MSKWTTNLPLSITVSALAIVTNIQVVAAQDGEPQATIKLDEITITAQRREQNINDVGISIEAYDADAIKNLRIQGGFDVAAYTPGLNMVASSGYSGKINFTLRGVGLNNFAESQEAAVAVYQDEIYLAPLIGSLVGVFDLERIEVLRGPQGTLFGRGATGGLVHYVSKKPTEEFEGYVGLQYGSYDERQVEAAVGGALGDKTAVRLSGYWQEYDGWLKNLNGPDQYGEERYAVRAQAMFKPTDNVELLLKAERAELKNEFGAAYLSENVYRDPADNLIKLLPADLDAHFTGAGNDWTGFRDTDGDFLTGSWDVSDDLRNDVERTLLSAVLTWNLGSATLTSITGYIEADKDYFDSNESNPTDFFHNGQLVETEQFVQELRLNGGTDQLHWTVGGFYLDYDIFNNTFFDLPSGFLPPFGGFFAIPVILDNPTNQSKTSIAGFGQVEYSLTDAVTLIAGARIEQEDAKFDYRNIYSLNPAVLEAFLGPPFIFNEALFGDLAVIDETYFSGTLGLDWRPNDSTLIYVSARRGVKPGAFNTPFNVIPPEEMKVKEEQLNAFEVGTKLTFLEGKAQLNAATFYYDYKDYQASLLEASSILLRNTDAVIYGLDLDLNTMPVAGLNLQLGLSLLEGEAKDVNFEAPSGVITRDREVPNMPNYSFNALARYEWPGLGGQLSLQADAQFQDQVFLGIQNHPANVSDQRTVTNIRAAWQKGNIEVALFAQNVLNEEYRAFAEDNVDFGGYRVVTPGKPRWWGIEFRYGWQK